jgi:hypothetical protein
MTAPGALPGGAADDTEPQLPVPRPAPGGSAHLRPGGVHSLHFMNEREFSAFIVN